MNCIRILTLPLLMAAFIAGVPASSFASGQAGLQSNDGRHEPPVTEIMATEASIPVVIDGIVNPLEWAGAPVISDFTARDPIEGAPPSQRTEVRVLYNRHYIFIAFSCYDTEPDKIIARVGSRDSWHLQTDMAHLDIDPYHDHRNAYHFTVSAANIQTEAYGWDTTWDGVWDSATRITDEGWFAEMAIPFSILRFEPKPTQTMGINFARKIQRTKEELQWLSWGRNEWRRVDRYGHLNNLQGLRSGHDLEIMPYVKAKGQQYYSSPTPPVGYIREELSDVGVDLKYGLTSNLALDVSLNPDFGQIAPDAEQINVTRYERHFRELRPFFQEGQTIFRTPLQIFYSRRIGKQIASGLEANLLAGVKLTGRTGPYQIGLINAATERKDYSVESGGSMLDKTEPMANYAVVRIVRDILARSTIGILAASKDTRSGGGKAPYQRSLGMDINLNLGENHYISSMLALSINPGTTGNDWAGQMKAGLRSDLWDYGAEFTYLGPDFNVNQVGYINQVDRREIGWNLGWKPRPEKYEIRRIELKTSGKISRNFTDLYTNGRYGVQLKFQATDYTEIEASVNLNDTRWRNVDDPDPGTTSIDARLYRGRDYGLKLNTDRTLNYSFDFSTSWGNFLDYRNYYWGHDRTIRMGFTFRPSPRFSGSVSLNHIREYFRDGSLDETKSLFVIRSSYYFTPKLSVKMYNQFRYFTNPDPDERDSAANTLNLVFSYFLNAKSILYVVYNEIREDDIAGWEYYERYGRLPLSDRALLIKLTYWFSL